MKQIQPEVLSLWCTTWILPLNRCCSAASADLILIKCCLWADVTYVVPISASKRMPIIAFSVILWDQASICFRLLSTCIAKEEVFFTLRCFWCCKSAGNAFKQLDFSFFHFFWRNVCAFLSGNFLFIIIVYLSLLYVLIKFFILECNCICGASCLQFWHKKLHPIPMNPSGPVNFVPGLSTFCAFCLFELSFNLGS